MSVRETILADIAARLAAIPGLGEPVARESSGDPTAFPALFLTEGPQESLPGDAQASRYRMAVLIEGYVKGGDGPAAAAARNTLYAAATAAIMADGLNLDGAVEDIQEVRFRPSVAELSNARRLAFELELEIQFSTRRGNPAQTA